MASEGYDKRDGEIESEDYKKYDINKKEYLEMMSEILDRTQENFDEREGMFIEEMKEKRSDLPAEKINDFVDILENDAKKNKMRFRDHAEKMNNFFENMHNTVRLE